MNAHPTRSRRRGVHRAQFIDEVLRVVSLVGAKRNRRRLASSRFRHLQRRDALGVAVGFGQTGCATCMERLSVRQSAKSDYRLDAWLSLSTQGAIGSAAATNGPEMDASTSTPIDLERIRQRAILNTPSARTRSISARGTQGIAFKCPLKNIFRTGANSGGQSRHILTAGVRVRPARSPCKSPIDRQLSDYEFS